MCGPSTLFFKKQVTDYLQKTRDIPRARKIRVLYGTHLHMISRFFIKDTMHDDSLTFISNISENGLASGKYEQISVSQETGKI